MTQSANFTAIFTELAKLLRPYGEALDCIRDDSSEYYLNTSHIMKNQKPLYFGSVQVKKNYVSYHLMPVYVFPDLLKGMSPELKKRMQGKSCFNFKTIDQPLFDELKALTCAGFNAYKKEGYV